MLAEKGYDVFSAMEEDPCASDEAMLALAHEEQRILVTEDKDFGDLVFVRRLPHPCIVRFTEMPVADKAAALRWLIEHHPDALNEETLIVVTKNRVRIRFREPEGRGGV